MRCHSGQLLTSPNNETSVIMYSLSYHSKSRFGKFLSGVGQLVSKGMRFSSKDPYLQWVIAWSWERWASWWTEIKGERMQHTLTTHLFCTIFVYSHRHTLTNLEGTIDKLKGHSYGERQDIGRGEEVKLTEN